MSDTAVELIASSPDRWRYAQLAAALVEEGAPPKTERAARLMLMGLAHPQTLYESLTTLIHDGYFGAAEEMLLELLESPRDAADTLTDEQFNQVETELGAVQSAAITETARSWADLNVQAAALDLPAESDDGLAELTNSALPEARSRIARRAERIEVVEVARRSALEERLEQRLAETGPGPGIGSWADAVRMSLRAREFRTAAAILDAGPDGRLDAGPLTVPPPPRRWPWPDRPVTEILKWYADRRSSPGAAFERFRPFGDDEAAERLITAMNSIAAEVDTDSVRGMATALTALIGDSTAPQAERVDGGFVTRVFGFHDDRLPRLPPIGDGVTMWVSAPDRAEESPPAELVRRMRPVVWFQPRMSAPAVPAGDIAVLDAATLLLLLAPDRPSMSAKPETRRINLLRLLVPQLDPQVVLGSGGVTLGERASRRDSLAWLFDLFGVLPDAPVLDGVLQDSGGYPEALRCLIDDLIGPANNRERRVSVADLQHTRNPAMHGRIRDAVMDTLDAHAPQRLALWLSLWQFDDDIMFIADDVLDAVQILSVSPRAADLVVNRQGISEALAKLTDVGLMRRDGDGFRIPPPGLAAALLDPSGSTPRQRAADVLEEIEQDVQSADDAAAAVLGRRIIHFIGHRVDNDVISVTERLRRAAPHAYDTEHRTELADIATRVQALGGGTFIRLYYDGLTPPARVECTKLVEDLIGDVEWHLPAGLHIRPRGDSSCWVLANPMILAEALRNLVLNSARALSSLRRADPKPAIQLSVRAVSDTEDCPVHVTAPAVVVEVADNGAGFSAEELERLRTITDPARPPWAPTMTTDGKGQGLPMTASMLRLYGGVLEIGNGSQELSGGCVRAWLPRLPEPTRT
jgi:signal transduction histidine kinase